MGPRYYSIHGIIRYMGERDLTFAGATPRAMEEWTNFVHQKAEGLLPNDVDSWMTGVNMNIGDKQVRRLARYGGTAPEHLAWCDSVVEGGYEEIRFE